MRKSKKKDKRPLKLNKEKLKVMGSGLENMTYKEVAQILSISDRTVHAQMCIAIRKIGIVIQEYRTGKKIK